MDMIKLVFRSAERKQIEGVSKQGAEANISTQEGGTKRRMEKLLTLELHNFDLQKCLLQGWNEGSRFDGKGMYVHSEDEKCIRNFTLNV